jgi:hypothetical protein
MLPFKIYQCGKEEEVLHHSLVADISQLDKLMASFQFGATHQAPSLAL